MLIAYVSGSMPVHERNDLERALERDPLLREAVEGLTEPGALEGIQGLEAHRPVAGEPGNSGSWWIVGTITLIVIVAGAWLHVELTRPMLPHQVIASEASDPINEQDPEILTTAPLDRAEIAVAIEQPESLLIGHGHDELHARALEQYVGIEREPGIALLDPLPTDPDTLRTSTVHRPARTARSSRQLVYIHDLKLVHPKEMYGPDPLRLVMEEHVTARHADRAAQERAMEPQRMKAYLPYFTEALRKFTRNDHKGCLEDLRFLLEQYPNDVNALFYAGLCSYNLGMYSRAGEFLERSAHHPIDTFDEESEWYLAQTLDRSGDREAAVAKYARIVADGGFYAQRARERLGLE